jgi:peptide/nickel transport system ATP-binding protein
VRSFEDDHNKLSADQNQRLGEQRRLTIILSGATAGGLLSGLALAYVVTGAAAAYRRRWLAASEAEHAATETRAQLVEAIRLHNDVTKQEARRRGIEALRSVGIPKPERRIDEYSFELSGGLRQRAMIAVALSCDPRLLIADEPTTALDVTTQAQILDLLRALQRERGMAIMLITHNLGVVAEMADDVVVMYLGRVVERGSVDAIFHDPRHPYTKALLQSIPSIESVPKEKLPTISGSIPHPFNRPKGCPFHPRCVSAMPGRCDTADPSLREIGDGRKASCFLYS